MGRVVGRRDDDLVRGAEEAGRQDGGIGLERQPGRPRAEIVHLEVDDERELLPLDRFQGEDRLGPAVEGFMKVAGVEAAHPDRELGDESAVPEPDPGPQPADGEWRVELPLEPAADGRTEDLHIMAAPR